MPAAKRKPQSQTPAAKRSRARRATAQAKEVDRAQAKQAEMPDGASYDPLQAVHGKLDALLSRPVPPAMFATPIAASGRFEPVPWQGGQTAVGSGRVSVGGDKYDDAPLPDGASYDEDETVPGPNAAGMLDDAMIGHEKALSRAGVLLDELEKRLSPMLHQSMAVAGRAGEVDGSGTGVPVVDHLNEHTHRVRQFGDQLQQIHERLGL